MKKYLVFTVIAVLFAALPAQAQFKWGVKGGVNLSSVSLKLNDVAGDIDPTNFTGFQVGPIMEFTVPIIGIGMDAAILYSQTGFKLKYNDSGVLGNESTIKTGSLFVPVNLKYKLSLLNIVGAYAAIGPYAEFKIHDSLGDFEDDFKVKSFGAGLNFGLGVELFSKIQVGANYQLGLTEDYGSADTIGMLGQAFKGKNRVWSITAALLF